MILFAMVMPQAMALLFAHAIPDADRSLLLQSPSEWRRRRWAPCSSTSPARCLLFASRRPCRRLCKQPRGTGCSNSSPRFSGNSARRSASPGGRCQKHRHIDSAGNPARHPGRLPAAFYLALMVYYSPVLGALAAACALLVIVSTAVCCLLLSRMQDSLLEIEGALIGQMVQLMNAISKFRVACAEQRRSRAGAGLTAASRSSRTGYKPCRTGFAL